MALRELAVALLFAAAAGSAHCGPFGLEMGMTVPQLKAVGIDVGNLKDGTLHTKAVPKPYDAFESYIVLVDPDLGLCRIAAIGKDIPVNSFGDQLKSEFKSIEDALTENYGAGKRYDFLQAGSIWREGKEWTMSLVKEERTLATIWSSTEGRFTPRDNIVAITLDSSAPSTSKAYVRLAYDFKNTRECLDKRKRQKAKAL